jgi:hypothetical protein
VESPTYDELDETLEEQYEDLPQVFEPLDIDLAFVFLQGRLEILAYALQREAEDELRAYTPMELIELTPAQRKTVRIARGYGASWWKTRQMVSQQLLDFNLGRGHEEQWRLYNLWKNGAVAGVPGESFHYRGWAIDFAELGIDAEPWHWEYNPTGRKMSRLRRWLLDIKLYWQERKYWREDGYRR